MKTDKQRKQKGLWGLIFDIKRGMECQRPSKIAILIADTRSAEERAAATTPAGARGQ